MVHMGGGGRGEDAWPMHIGSAGLHVEFTQKEMARSEDKIISTSHTVCGACHRNLHTTHHWKWYAHTCNEGNTS